MVISLSCVETSLYQDAKKKETQQQENINFASGKIICLWQEYVMTVFFITMIDCRTCRYTCMYLVRVHSYIHVLENYVPVSTLNYYLSDF